MHLLAKKVSTGGIFLLNMYIMATVQELSLFCNCVTEVKLCQFEVWSLGSVDFQRAACVPSPEQSRYIGFLGAAHRQFCKRSPLHIQSTSVIIYAALTYTRFIAPVPLTKVPRHPNESWEPAEPVLATEQKATEPSGL